MNFQLNIFGFILFCNLFLFSSFVIGQSRLYHTRIVGGSEADKGENDYVVALGGKGICGGSLIKSNYVLTAAHCVDGMKPSFVHIGGYAKGGKDGEKINVKRVISHPDYSKGNYDNDFAILELEQPSKRSPIRLAAADGSDDKGSATAQGWGTTTQGGSLSPVLKEVDLPILRNEKCQKMNGLTITTNMICAGGKKGEDSCQGDSGGPLIIRKGVSDSSANNGSSTESPLTPTNTTINGSSSIGDPAPPRPPSPSGVQSIKPTGSAASSFEPGSLSGLLNPTAVESNEGHLRGRKLRRRSPPSLASVVQSILEQLQSGSSSSGITGIPGSSVTDSNTETSKPAVAVTTSKPSSEIGNIESTETNPTFKPTSVSSTNQGSETGSVLVGVVSFGPGCAQAGKAGVYARISAQRDWIDKIIDGN